MKNRDIIIQLITSAIVCAILTTIFASFEYSSNGSTYVKLNFRDTIPFLFYFIGAAIPSLILGLFFRLNKNLKNWLRKNYWINIVCCIIGITLWIYSMKDSNIVVDKYRMDGMDFEYWHPKYSLQISGWFILIFGALNMYLPERKTTT